MAGDPVKAEELRARLIEAFVQRFVDIDGDPNARAAMDQNGDATVELEEAVAYALKQPDWEKYRDVLTELGIQHPLDTSKFPPAINRRIAHLVRTTERKIGLKRTDPNYCRAFTPAFVEAGKPSFRKGGLCFGYTEKRTLPLYKEPEMTAVESFDLCLHPNRGVYGSCSEKTYEVLAALQAAGVPCDVQSRYTDMHVYPALGEMSLDPSDIGEIAWSQPSNAAAIYLYSLAGKEQNSSPVDVAEVARLLEPQHYAHWSRVKEHVERLKLHLWYDWHLKNKDIYKKHINVSGWKRFFTSPDLNKRHRQEVANWHRDFAETHKRIQEDRTAIFDEIEPLISEHPKSVIPFMVLAGQLSPLPQDDRIGMGIAVLKRWPDNPYALQPLLTAVQLDEDRAPAMKGDAKASKRFEHAIQSLAARLREEFPFSGTAETVLAFAAGLLGRMEEQDALSLQALAQNPRDAVALQMLASDDLANGRYTAAGALIRDAIAIAPNRAGNHSTLAVVAQLQNNFEEAEAEAKKEYTVSYPNIGATLLAANLALLRGNTKRAAEILNWFGHWETVNTSSWYLAQMAQIQQMRGNIREARRIVTQQFGSAPADHNARFTLINLAIEENDIPTARRLVAGLRQPWLAMTRALYELQLSLLENNLPSFKRGLEALRRREGIDPTIILRYEAALDGQEGRLDAAREKCARLASRNPKDYSSRSSLISLDILQGRIAAAERGLAAFAKDHPDLFVTKMLRSWLLLRQGRWGEARTAAETALKLNPRSWEALVSKGYALVNLGRAPEALTIAKQLDAMLPRQPAGKYLMARALLAMGKPEKAKELLPKIREVDNYDLKAWPLVSSSALERDIEAALAKKR